MFLSTFGNALPAIEAVLATGRCPHVRIQVLWSDTHSFGDKDIPAITKGARQCQAIKKKFPNVTVEISPFCEHNLNAPDKYLDIVAKNAPDCVPVNTPWKGKLSTKYKNEVHGSHKPPSTGRYNYSYDGTNCVDSNVEKDKTTHGKSDVFFFWHPRFNLKWSMKDKTPRPERRAFPDSYLIDSIIYLHTQKGKTNLPLKTWLQKTHADRHQQIDPKGDKLLIISPIKSKEIQLRTRNGQVVDTLRYYGSFDGGGYRYYSGTYGYLVAQKAKRIQGDPLCEVWVNGKKHGVVNPGFRDSTFR
jgi:hypothetical protein